MVINALKSGAKMFMADFEEANSPTWGNMVEGQVNLRDAIRRTISFTNPNGKEYKPGENSLSLSLGRAAGIWSRSTALSTAKAVAGGLFNFGLYFFHNAKEQAQRASSVRRMPFASFRESVRTIPGAKL